MLELDTLSELENKNDAYIEKTFLNILKHEEISEIKVIRDELINLYKATPDFRQTPEWFQTSFHTAFRWFNEIFFHNKSDKNKIDVFEIHTRIIYGSPETKYYFPLPAMLSFAKSESLEDFISTRWNDFDNVNNTIDRRVQEKWKEAEELLKKLEVTREKSDERLSLLDKEVGKIGVKNYAVIFDEQALEHSNSFKNIQNGVLSFGFVIGKAQIWIVIALLFIFSLGYLAFNLDTLFPISGNEYTPLVMVHLLGRIVSVSLVIFLISFAFKQFRINMHLYTLNKHRANTLKSFEYLTKAPDKLEAGSYNAILMKVAEAIYESGQTGYITTTETHGDMPSIIDMTKIVNPGK